MDDLGDRRPEDLIQLLILLRLLLVLTPYRPALQMRVAMVAQPIGVVHPREGLAVHSSGLLVLQRLVEAIYDADQEVFPHLTDLLTVIRLIPLSKHSWYICAGGLFFLVCFHEGAEGVMRDGLILGRHHLEVVVQVLISISIVVILHLSS